MRTWLMLKRLALTPALLVMLAVTFICIVLCGTLSSDDGMPSCGIVCGSDSLAQSIAESLEKEGLILCKDEKDLKEKLARGNITMGVILPDDLTERLMSGDTDEMIRFIETPVTFLPSLYRYRVASHIIEAFTPHLTSKLLTDMGFAISYEQMQEAIDEYLTDETDFAFTIESVEGTRLETEHYVTKLSTGALALFLFFAFGLFAVPYSEKQFLPIAKRVGLKKAMLSYALPSALLVIILFAAVSAAALALSDALFESQTAKLIVSAVVYTVFLSALGMIVTAVFRSTEYVRAPMIVLCILSLGFCPIFANLPALLGIPEWISYILPPMFLYAAIEQPLICAVIAAILLITASSTLYSAYKKRFCLK